MRWLRDAALPDTFGPRGGPTTNLSSGRRFFICWALDFRCRVDLGTRGIASPPGLNVDFVVNTTLFVKTLQVRQQGGLRELHRL
jgi:hypothetical protein